MENPFTNRVAIRNPEDFFGREREVMQIYERLRNMQSTSVVGERRIGKSSLLWYVVENGCRQLDEGYKFVYVDHQNARFHSATGWLREVLKSIGANGDCIVASKTVSENLVAFSCGIERSHQKVVLCLDEFERVFFRRRYGFDDSFFDHMRSELGERKMAFVTATERRLRDLSMEGKVTSPFFNVFTVTRLEEFSEVEAADFVTEYSRRVGFDLSERRFLEDRMERHPLKLQIVCDKLIQNRQRTRRLGDAELVSEVEAEIARFFLRRYHPRRMGAWIRKHWTAIWAMLQMILEARLRRGGGSE